MENPIPVNVQGKTNHAKTTFLYILSLVALAFVSISSGIAIFQIINKYIIDFAATYSSRYSDEALKFSISALIIATPVYYVLIKFINKEIAQRKLNNDSAIRKWLTYLILLITSIIILIWLIITLNRFFDGELTSKSILKVLTILTICGTIFSFYLYDIRRNLENKAIGVTIFFYGSLIAIIVTLIGAFFTIDSPTLARNQRADKQTTDKLSSIHYAIENYYSSKNILPENLNELLKQKIYPVSEEGITNEATNKKFDYKKISANEYELCTDFLTATNETKNDYRYYDPNEKTWNHEKGYECFEIEVNKIVNPKQIKEFP